jgi:hypothetical protein
MTVHIIVIQQSKHIQTKASDYLHKGAATYVSCHMNITNRHGLVVASQPSDVIKLKATVISRLHLSISYTGKESACKCRHPIGWLCSV